MKKQSYKTIDKIFTYEIDKIKGSRFIAYAIPIKSENDVKDELSKLRKEYYDARHHCYAYMLGSDDNVIFKYSDDGEPSKTAGFPIYTVLNSYDATNLLIVVIRYFGGTKLGTGGLVKAYTTATQELLEQITFIDVELKSTIKIKFSYDLTKQIYYVLNTYEGFVKNEEYGSDILFEIDVNISFIDYFKSDLIEKTDGKVVFL
jgi:uncharacterized YigZ family protein